MALTEIKNFCQRKPTVWSSVCLRRSLMTQSFRRFNHVLLITNQLLTFFGLDTWRHLVLVASAGFPCALLGGIALAAQAFSPIPTHFFLASSVVRRLSHLFPHSADLDAIWHVNLWGPMTPCIRWDPWIPVQRRGDLGVEPPAKHAIANCSQTVGLMLPPGEYKRGVRWTCHSYSAFCPTTLVLIVIFCALIFALLLLYKVMLVSDCCVHC